MNFNKENMRHMRHLIVFTLVLLIALWNYTKVFGFLGFLWNIAFPFLMGGAIAFILNVPMSFLERNIFKKETALKNKRVQKLSRPVSLVLTIIGFGNRCDCHVCCDSSIGADVCQPGQKYSAFYPAGDSVVGGFI